MAHVITNPKSETASISHLLRRAGFGATPEETRYYSTLGYDRTVEELLNPGTVDNTRLDKLVQEQDFDFTRPEDLKRWWLFRMIFTRCPLEEKLTLFWHGHFATSNKKVKASYAMYLQNLLLRKHALGDFHAMLQAVSRDPAMIIWLDNQHNGRYSPNENYAREVMELFTVGIGNYSETDVKEAARAFTGWHVRQGTFFFNRNLHDFGTKSFLSTSGTLNGDQIVTTLVEHPATARFLARKLVAFFVADTPDQAIVDAVAGAYVESRYHIRPMLKAIFMHPNFLGSQAYHGKIKSPAELVVGSLKNLQVKQLDADLTTIMSRMGQDLFNPPSVKGWDGGAAWISTDTMMERFNLAARLTGEKFDELEFYFSPSQMVHKEGLRNARQMVDYFLSLLVDGDVPAATRTRLVAYVSSDVSGNHIDAIPDDTILDTKLRGLVRLIMTLPTYQLA